MKKHKNHTYADKMDEISPTPGSIFLSHNNADKPFVRELSAALGEYGISTWVDEASMLVGDSLIEKIQQGISTMDYLGVILTPSSVSSSWVNTELKLALSMEISQQRVKVLPILRLDCEIPTFLLDKIYVDFRDLTADSAGFRAAIEQLVRRVHPESLSALAPTHGAESETPRDSTDPVLSPDPTNEANQFLGHCSAQWKRSKSIIGHDQLNYLFDNRRDLWIEGDNWLVVAESALSDNSFSRWTGVVENHQVWTAIKRFLIHSSDKKVRQNAASFLKDSLCTDQDEYPGFVASILYECPYRDMRETLIKSIAAIDDQVTFDRLIQRYLGYSHNAKSRETLIRLTMGKRRWEKKLGVSFYLDFVTAQHPICEATHEALKVLSRIGDEELIEPLKKLHSQGFSGHEGIGEAYLEEIANTLQTLGADVRDLERS